MIVAPGCGLTRPLTVATSVSVPGPPSVMAFEAFVVIVGCAGATTTFSLASLQAPVTGALFASPL